MNVHGNVIQESKNAIVIGTLTKLVEFEENGLKAPNLVR